MQIIRECAVTSGFVFETANHFYVLHFSGYAFQNILQCFHLFWSKLYWVWIRKGMEFWSNLKTIIVVKSFYCLTNIFSHRKNYNCKRICAIWKFDLCNSWQLGKIHILLHLLISESISYYVQYWWHIFYTLVQISIFKTVSNRPIQTDTIWSKSETSITRN